MTDPMVTRVQPWFELPVPFLGFLDGETEDRGDLLPAMADACAASSRCASV
jgi:hypothetical protein